MITMSAKILPIVIVVVGQVEDSSRYCGDRKQKKEEGKK